MKPESGDGVVARTKHHPTAAGLINARQRRVALQCRPEAITITPHSKKNHRKFFVVWWLRMRNPGNANLKIKVAEGSGWQGFAALAGNLRKTI